MQKYVLILVVINSSKTVRIGSDCKGTYLQKSLSFHQTPMCMVLAQNMQLFYNVSHSIYTGLKEHFILHRFIYEPLLLYQRSAHKKHRLSTRRSFETLQPDNYQSRRIYFFVRASLYSMPFDREMKGLHVDVQFMRFQGGPTARTRAHSAQSPEKVLFGLVLTGFLQSNLTINQSKQYI